jgi:hypothetical protein
MSLFVSYSHADSDFVDQLAGELIRARKHVWIDRYEISAGQSLITTIQEAIGTAGAMLVVLSKASVQSEWCKKELSAGLIRELDEKRVMVIPLLIEDCDIPLFLRDKYYADFRINFAKGVRDVLEAVSSITSDVQGRIHTAEHFTDWAVDWDDSEHMSLRITVVEHHRVAPYSALTVINVNYNEEATERYRRFARAGFDGFARHVLYEAMAQFAKDNDLFLLLDDQFEKTLSFGMLDTKSPARHEVSVTSRRLGDDTGKDILINIGGQLQSLRDAAMAASGKMSQAESIKLINLLRGEPAG